MLLQQLTFIRLEESRALLNAGHFAGAWYLSGYVLETALKAVICKTLNVAEYPETALKGNPFKTHVAADLVLSAGLRSELDTKLSRPVFKANWLTVTEWQPEERYKAIRTRQDVLDMLRAYEDKTEGVLTWLTSRW